MYRVVVLALALAIMALPAFAAGEEDASEAATGATGPQYGGTLTLGYADLDPPTADVVEGRWPTTKYTSFVLDYLLTADIDKFGPRGQNAHAFTAPLSVPEEYTRGGVIEDWEITPDKLIFRIRPGVQWGGSRQGTRHGITRAGGRGHRLQPDALLDRTGHGMAGDQRVSGLAGRHVRGRQVHVRGRIQVLQRGLARAPGFRLGQ